MWLHSTYPKPQPSHELGPAELATGAVEVLLCFSLLFVECRWTCRVKFEMKISPSVCKLRFSAALLRDLF